MKSALQITPFFLSSLALAAHFLRQGSTGFLLIYINLPLLLLLKRRWGVRIIQFFLLLGIIEWLRTIDILVNLRMDAQEPWLQMVIIFFFVILFVVYALLNFERKKWQDKFQVNSEYHNESFFTFLLTILILTIVQIKVKSPIMLLLERFIPGGGWFEIFLLAIYGAFVTELILGSKDTAPIRSKIWFFFSIVFFSQLILGISGIDRMLMTGDLHIPVPALIMAGPIFRGEKFFMTILFLSTILLVGPAWCSYLCYIGSWDDLFSRKLKKSKKISPIRHKIRIIIFLLVIALAILLRLFSVSIEFAAGMAIGFGIIGVTVMTAISGKTGTMYHCITWCPIGLVANILGRLSPFRVKILQDCDRCNLCIRECRYNALTKTDIEEKKPAITCTLCGDCIGSCESSQLVYTFFNKEYTDPQKFQKVRNIFYTLVISLHASFLGLARL